MTTLLSRIFRRSDDMHTVATVLAQIAANQRLTNDLLLTIDGHFLRIAEERREASRLDEEDRLAREGKAAQERADWLRRMAEGRALQVASNALLGQILRTLDGRRAPTEHSDSDNSPSAVPSAERAPDAPGEDSLLATVAPQPEPDPLGAPAASIPELPARRAAPEEPAHSLPASSLNLGPASLAAPAPLSGALA